MHKFNEQSANEIFVIVCCLRLPHVTTDILISINSPLAISPESSSAEAVVPALVAGHAAREVVAAEFTAMVASFTIRDFGLFGA